MGLSRTGIAVSDSLGLCAFPRDFISHRDLDTLFSELVRIISCEEITHVVIGKPINMDGSDSQMSVLAGELAKKLETLGIAGIFLFDERRTSVHAMQVLHSMGITEKKGKGRKDSVAASIMLSSFMEKQRTLREGNQE